MSKPEYPDWKSGQSYFVTTAAATPGRMLSTQNKGVSMEPLNVPAANQEFKVRVCDLDLGPDGYTKGVGECVDAAVCANDPLSSPVCSTGSMTLWTARGDPPQCLFVQTAKGGEIVQVAFHPWVCAPLDATAFPRLVVRGVPGGPGESGASATAVLGASGDALVRSTHAPSTTPSAQYEWIVEDSTIPCCQGASRTDCGAYTPEAAACFNVAMDNFCAPGEHTAAACTAWVDAVKGAVQADPSSAAALSTLLAARLKARPYDAAAPDPVYTVMAQACDDLGGACTAPLTTFCASHKAEDLVKDPLLLRLCGCYLPAAEYTGTPSPGCDPLCAWAGAVTNPAVPACPAGTCYLDDTTASLLKDAPSEVEVSEMCRACASGPCSCHMAEADVDAVMMAAVGKVDFAAACDACYTYDAAGGAPKKVSCKTFTNLPPPPPTPHKPIPQPPASGGASKHTVWIIGGVLVALLLLLFLVLALSGSQKSPSPPASPLTPTAPTASPA